LEPNGSRHGDERTLETLIAFRAEHAALIFRVATGGCTTADDFRVDVELVESGPVAISLHRLRADTCKAFIPEGVEIRFERAELGIPAGRPLVIRNPFAAHL
jgi:hypothetical protein